MQQKINSIEKQYSALIYGSTGAVGRQLVSQLLVSPNWKRIIVVVRNPLPQWASHPKKDKLKIQVLSNMDDLLTPQKFTYQNVDCLFCCLGSMVKYGEQTFVKIDKTYPLKAADIALKNKIPQYILVSSMGANSNSCLLYPRTKGQVQQELKDKKLPLLTVTRPGLIANRTNARFGQKLFSCCLCCCIPKIQVVDLGKVLKVLAQRDMKKSKSQKQIFQLYQNSDLLQILQNGSKVNSDNSKQTLLNKK